MTTTVRRTPARIANDRADLLRYFGESADSWRRPPKSARASDLTALVAAGHLVRTVRREYDTQRFAYATDAFGGAGVCVRRRAYYALPTPGGQPRG